MHMTDSLQQGPTTVALGEMAHAARDRPADVPERRFVWHTSVFFDDLDAMGMLHNAAYVVLVERAASAFFEAHGWRWEKDPVRNPDQHYVVREQTVRYFEPILGPGEVVVEMWVSRLGQTSASFGFEVRSSGRVHALVERVHVKLDPVSLRPAPWTDRLRDQLAAVVRPSSQ